MTRADRLNPNTEAAPPDVDLNRVWATVAGEIWAPAPGRIERLLSYLGLPQVIGKVMSAAPSLKLSWITATAVMLAVGVLVTRATDQPWVALLAPALTAISVAFAFGPGVDPAFEVTQTTPVSERMVLLARVVAVVVVNAVLGIIASSFSSVAWEITFAWLLPMAAVAGVALVIAVVSGSPLAGAGIGQLAWMVVIAANAYQTHDLSDAILEPRLHITYLVVALVCFAAVIWTSDNMRWKRTERWI